MYICILYLDNFVHLSISIDSASGTEYCDISGWTTLGLCDIFPIITYLEILDIE